MSDVDDRGSLADRYNESIVMPPQVSVNLPPLLSPRSPCPSSETVAKARSQIIKFLLALLLVATTVTVIMLAFYLVF